MLTRPYKHSLLSFSHISIPPDMSSSRDRKSYHLWHLGGPVLSSSSWFNKPCIHHLSWNHFYMFIFPTFFPSNNPPTIPYSRGVPSIEPPKTHPHLSNRSPNIGYITRFLLLDQGACLGSRGGGGRRFHQGFGRSLLAHLFWEATKTTIHKKTNQFTNVECLFL